MQWHPRDQKRRAYYSKETRPKEEQSPQQAAKAKRL